MQRNPLVAAWDARLPVKTRKTRPAPWSAGSNLPSWLAAFVSPPQRNRQHEESISQRIGRLLWGQPEEHTYILTRWLFLRLLGVVYFIAFASLSRQILGLIGRNGILPAAEFLEAVRAPLGPRPYWQLQRWPG